MAAPSPHEQFARPGRSSTVGSQVAPGPLVGASAWRDRRTPSLPLLVLFLLLLCGGTLEQSGASPYQQRRDGGAHRVAIVGTGISGAATAHHLRVDEAELRRLGVLPLLRCGVGTRWDSGTANDTEGPTEGTAGDGSYSASTSSSSSCRSGVTPSSQLHITAFERAARVGGRLRSSELRFPSSSATHSSSLRVEQGASLYHTSNRYMREYVRRLNLTETRTGAKRRTRKTHGGAWGCRIG
eukprot:GHVU01021395.1.p1 GENE.GHVU01021395.1~~GHVU01021395.1.p1  ORF type:complete len:240 (-),score=21.61 GHVU01021395.1:1491-2210(-)